MGAAPIIAMNLRNVYCSFRFDTMATATVCRKLPSHACGVHAQLFQEILDVFGRLRQVNWWQQIMHTCQGAWGWGWGRVGQPSWNGLNMPMMQGDASGCIFAGETCDMICMLRMCCRNHNSCQGSFRCRSGMSSFEHENSIRLVTEQGYAAFANVFVCCDVVYIKLDVLSNVFLGNTDFRPFCTT